MQEQDGKGKVKTKVDLSSIETVRDWFAKNSSTMPPEILAYLNSILAVADSIFSLAQSNNKLRSILAQHFGQIPKSEKISSDKNSSETIEAKPEDCTTSVNSGEDNSLNITSESPVNEGNHSTKKPSSHKEKLHRPHPPKPRKKRKSPENCANLNPDVDFSVLSDMENKRNDNNNLSTKVDREAHFMPKDAKYLRSKTHKRKIYNIAMFVEELNVDVETVTNVVTGQSVTAEVSFAPKQSNFSYNTILYMVLMHVEFFTPLHRLERMYKGMLDIPRSTLYRFCQYVAQAFLAIYLQEIKNLLEKADTIQMDDTKSKVLKQATEEELDEDEEEDEDFRGLVNPNLKVHKKIHEAIGLNSHTKDGKKRKVMNVSLLTGETKTGDPKSRVTIYLSHFGQAGDLLDKLLKYRGKDKDRLDIICDLAAFNKPSTKNMEEHNVVINGCASHSRRKFWFARELDDGMYYMLRCFKFLYFIESEYQDNKELLLKRRQTYAAKVWEWMIKYCAETVVTNWPKQSTPREAADYLLRNQKELTRYLDNPNVSIDNNRSERALRPEKLMLANSKQRSNSEGRAIIDILRTIMCIARHSQVKWLPYATDVLRNRDKVLINPELWTPSAWKQRN